MRTSPRKVAPASRCVHEPNADGRIIPRKSGRSAELRGRLRGRLSEQIRRKAHEFTGNGRYGCVWLATWKEETAVGPWIGRQPAVFDSMKAPAGLSTL